MKVVIDLPSMKKAISNVRKFVSETHITIEDGCLVVREMSLDKVAFYEAIIEDVEFDDETFELFVNAEHFSKVLKSLGKSKQVKLDYDQGKLTITGDGKKKFQIPVYEDNEEGQKLPDLKPTLMAQIPSGKLADIVSSVQATNKNIQGVLFEYDGKKLTVKGAIDSYKYEEEVEEFATNSTTTTSTRQNIGWLSTITECLVNEVVQFNYGQDYPLTIIDKGTDKIRQRFIIAPRIDND